MRTHAAHTLVQLCASTWVWSLAVWAAPLEDRLLQVEHRGTVEIPLPNEGPLGGMGIPEGGSFMVSELDGSYRFGLQSKDQWREESRSVDGVVKGRYVYQNPEGQMVDISYNAGPQGFIAEGDAIPGGRAPLVDAPIDDNTDRLSHATTKAVEEVKGMPYGALRLSENSGPQDVVVVRADNTLYAGVPYGALSVRGLPGFEPVFPGDNNLGEGKPYGFLRENINVFENAGADAIIVTALEDNTYGGINVLEDAGAQAIIVSALEDWPPELSFEPLPEGRDVLNGIVYGPPILNGEELKSGVIVA